MLIEKIKKVTLKQIIIILVLAFIAFTLFFRHKPFNSIKADDIKTVQHYSGGKSSIVNKLTPEETKEFLDVVSNLRISPFPIFIVREMHGGMPVQFTIKLKDGTVYDITTDNNNYLSINGKPFLVNKSALNKMNDFHFKIEAKHYEDNIGNIVIS